MPLGIRQNNNLQHITLDIWKDQVFLNEKSYPAGYFAANILNQKQETFYSLIHYGGAISYEAEALMKADRDLCQAASTGAVGCLRPTGCAVDLPALLLSESGRRAGGAGQSFL